MNFNFFPISWNCHESDIRVYGMREHYDRPVCIRIANYHSSVTVELPNSIVWSGDVVEQTLAVLKKAMYGVVPVEYHKKRSRLLYGAHVDCNGEPTLFDFLVLKFEMPKSAQVCAYILQTGINVPDIGTVIFRTHLAQVPLWSQFVLANRLPICDWLRIENAQEVINARKLTICDHEYMVAQNCVYTCAQAMLPPSIPVLAYDIETFSSTAAMCNPDVADDKIFQISMAINNQLYLLTRGIVNEETLCARYPKFKVHVVCVRSETELIECFVRTILAVQPLIITGYNNMGFDGTYIITRAKKYANCWNILESLTYCPQVLAVEKEVAWSSAARPDQKFNYMQSEGICIVDMMVLIRQDYGSKLDSFKLQHVVEYFLNDSKDDMSAAQMHNIMRRVVLTPQDEWCRNQLTMVGAYCMKDSLLVLDLMSKLETVYSLIAMANVCSCKLEDLCLRGQQNKIMSLIMRFCHNENIVVDKVSKGETKRESYRGATVFDPMVGLHENIVSFDFTSLYPSVIIANNLCVSTLVDDKNTTIPRDKCRILEWEDHVKCEHDIKWVSRNQVSEQLKVSKSEAHASGTRDAWQRYVDLCAQRDRLSQYNPQQKFCIRRRFVWYMGYVGVYPQILEMLMAERVKVKRILKQKVQVRKTMSDQDESARQADREIAVLDKKQLALKLVCNSLYGFTGSATSPIPCVPIAMCTTYAGRQVIQQASHIIETQFGGVRVYGDTDSNYVKFSNYNDYASLHEFAKQVAAHVSAQFHKNINIEYEDEVYAYWFISNKKQYCYVTRNQDNSVNNKLKAKGMCLVRRDSCEWIRAMVSRVMWMIFEKQSVDHVVAHVLDACLQLCCRQVDVKYLATSRMVGSFGDGHNVCVDDGGRTNMGKYFVAKWTDETQKSSALVKSGHGSESTYYRSRLPAHVQLALRMIDRGTLVVPGERLTFVVTNLKLHEDKLNNRLENVTYYRENAQYISIDFLYYIKLVCNVIDTLIDVQYGRHVDLQCLGHCMMASKCAQCKRNMAHVERQIRTRRCEAIYEQCVRKNKCNQELLNLFRPTIVYE